MRAFLRGLSLRLLIILYKIVMVNEKLTCNQNSVERARTMRLLLDFIHVLQFCR